MVSTRKFCRAVPKRFNIIVHVILVIRVFLYQMFYFSIMKGSVSTRGQILKPVTCIEPSLGLSGNGLQMISLTQNSDTSLTSK